MIKTIFRLWWQGDADLIRYVIDGQVAVYRDFFLRYIYAQHNARVIIDFEERMSGVICEASGHMMSKPYYALETMLPIIREHIESQWSDGYAEGRKDLCEELGIVDPEMEGAPTP